MLKQDMPLEIMNYKDHCLKGKSKKWNWINER